MSYRFKFLIVEILFTVLLIYIGISGLIALTWPIWVWVCNCI